MKHLIVLFAALTMTAYAGNAKQTDDTLYYLCDNNEKGKLDFEDEILVITRTPEGEFLPTNHKSVTENCVLTQKNVIKLCILNVKHT